MILREDQKIIVQGAITIENVVTMTQRGVALFDEQPVTIDLGKVTEVDSTIISMLLEWLRAARQKDCQLQFINLPASLESLIQLYGIAALIPVIPGHDTQQSSA